MNNKVSVSEDLEKVVEEIVDHTVLNAYGVKEIANRLRRTMIEPVSEDLDFEQELYKAFGQVKDFTLGMRIAKHFFELGLKARKGE